MQNSGAILPTPVAEVILRLRLGEPAKPPTKRVVGFQTPSGKVLAIQRKAKKTRVWFEPPAPPEIIDGLKVLDDPSNGNSNLNGPLRRLSLPETLRVEVDTAAAMNRFLDWYLGGISNVFRQMLIEHTFFPVGQGLFAAGSIEFPPNKYSPRRRKVELSETVPTSPFRWTYDCGTSSPQRLISNAIENLRHDCAGSPIDLVILSHFHSDHISGTVELLGQIGAKTLVLPWAPLWQRLVIGFAQGFSPTDSEMEFFVDPVRYLGEQSRDGFERVLFVLPSIDEGPPILDEPFRLPPDGPLKPEYRKKQPEKSVADDLELAETADTDNYQIDILAPGHSIIVASLWEFVPYNDPATEPANPSNFRSEVQIAKTQLLRGGKSERHSALQKLCGIYLNHFGRSLMNDVSLFVYAGPIGVWKINIHDRRCSSRSHGLVNRTGVHERGNMLYTGDGNLSSDAKWKSLESFLNPRRATGTSLFQVPHHGARANWHDGLATKVNPASSVFSSDPRHSYGHPHADVLRDFWPHTPLQVDAYSDLSTRFQLIA